MGIDTTKLFRGLMEYSRFSLIPTEKAFITFCKARKLGYSKEEIHKYLVRTNRIGYIVVINRFKFSYLKTHKKAKKYYRKYRYLKALGIRKSHEFTGFQTKIKIGKTEYLFMKHTIIIKNRDSYRIIVKTPFHKKILKKIEMLKIRLNSYRKMKNIQN